MIAVYVKIKDKKHAIKVIKRLVRIGYQEFDSWGYTLPIEHAKSIAVYSDGDYQLLSQSKPHMIKPKDIMNSTSVNYFMEYKYV